MRDALSILGGVPHLCSSNYSGSCRCLYRQGTLNFVTYLVNVYSNLSYNMHEWCVLYSIQSIYIYIYIYIYIFMSVCGFLLMILKAESLPLLPVVDTSGLCHGGAAKQHHDPHTPTQMDVQEPITPYKILLRLGVQSNTMGSGLQLWSRLKEKNS